MRFQLDHFESPLRTILLVTDESGTLRALDFADQKERMQRLLRQHYGDFQLRGGSASPLIHDALAAYFSGQLQALDELCIATAGTPFQRQVWTALRSIPAAQTISYAELAARIHRPSASRAVGAANGANPIAIVVPCHRIVGSQGTLTGYGGGLWRKQWLLEHEARYCNSRVGTNIKPLSRNHSSEVAGTEC